MTDFLDTISNAIISFADFICGYPLFIVLIGGGLYLSFRSRFVSLRRLPHAIRALRSKEAAKRLEDNKAGQISSVHALLNAIAATVGMGNIAGVAIALCIGGPGAIFWLWISAIIGMNTKFFEGALSIMYKGKDSKGELQGGPMYMIVNGLGKRWRPLAVVFSVAALLGCLVLMQANQLTETITTVVTTPMGLENTVLLRSILGIAIAAIVAIVVLGGLKRISQVSARLVPFMVMLYFLLVLIILILHYDRLPAVFAAIFREAFNFQAGFGALAGIAIIGIRRAALVNEAGVGTASMMHGASKNTNPLREGLIAMLGPAIDSGLVCTLTAIPLLIAGIYADSEGVKGVHIALQSFEQLLPGFGKYALTVVLFTFALSTMFSYSYYGQKCTDFLFGAGKAKYYTYFYIITIAVAAVIPLTVAVSLIDIGFAFMAFATVTTLLILSPKVTHLAKSPKDPAEDPSAKAPSENPSASE
ncbi:MAG: amino acid carrier protein [Muribaculaceae bacterium]|nr:amino acid carrier protein [Muribaculaceae bacterium]